MKPALAESGVKLYRTIWVVVFRLLTLCSLVGGHKCFGENRLNFEVYT
jgi:hypothetical protein